MSSDREASSTLVLPRRTLLLAAVSVLGSACGRSAASGGAVPVAGAVPVTGVAPGAGVAASAAPENPFQALEQRAGGRLGVFALDTESGREWAQRADERFAMCSTFKWLLVASVLQRVERGQLALDTQIRFGAADLLEHAPVCRERAAEGSLSIAELARAAVTVSDNTAANLLLAQIGGPAAVTELCRSLGDEWTRLDRYEEVLNENAPGDERDTTTPRAMVLLMQRLLCEQREHGTDQGRALSPASRERLLGWMRESSTGLARLRAGLPAAWNAGDKTGTGPRGACNDVAIAFPPGRAPLLVAAYLSDGQSPLDVLNGVHADVARHIVADLG